MARPPGMKKGGDTKEMAKKEVAFMKKKGAPKSMIRHEEKEYGMKKGVKKMAMGGEPAPLPFSSYKVPKMQGEGPVQQRNTRFAKGGSVGGSYRRAADGIASKGKTKGKMVRMNYGGKC
jgi:hypothetical protein